MKRVDYGHGVAGTAPSPAGDGGGGGSPPGATSLAVAAGGCSDAAAVCVSDAAAVRFVQTSGPVLQMDP
jgi:hypothetical protein